MDPADIQGLMPVLSSVPSDSPVVVPKAGSDTLVDTVVSAVTVHRTKETTATESLLVGESEQSCSTEIVKSPALVGTPVTSPCFPLSLDLNSSRSENLINDCVSSNNPGKLKEVKRELSWKITPCEPAYVAAEDVAKALPLHPEELQSTKNTGHPYNCQEPAGQSLKSVDAEEIEPNATSSAATVADDVTRKDGTAGSKSVDDEALPPSKVGRERKMSTDIAPVLEEPSSPKGPSSPREPSSPKEPESAESSGTPENALEKVTENPEPVNSAEAEESEGNALKRERSRGEPDPAGETEPPAKREKGETTEKPDGEEDPALCLSADKTENVPMKMEQSNEKGQLSKEPSEVVDDEYGCSSTGAPDEYTPVNPPSRLTSSAFRAHLLQIAALRLSEVPHDNVPSSSCSRRSPEPQSSTTADEDTERQSSTDSRDVSPSPFPSPSPSSSNPEEAPQPKEEPNSGSSSPRLPSVKPDMKPDADSAEDRVDTASPILEESGTSPSGGDAAGTVHSEKETRVENSQTDEMSELSLPDNARSLLEVQVEEVEARTELIQNPAAEEKRCFRKISSEVKRRLTSEMFKNFKMGLDYGKHTPVMMRISGEAESTAPGTSKTNHARKAAPYKATEPLRQDPNSTWGQIKLDGRFATYDQFSAALRQYEQKNAVVFTTYDCKKLKNDSKLVYRYIMKGCKHYGTKRVNRKQKYERPNQRTFKMECPVHITVKKVKDILQIVSIVEQHNHVTDHQLIRHYPERRRLSKDELSNLFDVRVNPMKLQERLQETTGKPIKIKDICNLRHRLNSQRLVRQECQ